MIRKLLCLAMGLSSAAIFAQTPVHEYQLDNGLKLLVRPDHRAPVVVSQIWYKVGASYENNGITGISHALEHMMFKGTEKVPPGEFSKLIKANGGRDNAFTGRDYTAYFQLLEKSRLPVSFELEADRMRNLTLPKDEFIKELEVVKEERRLRTEDNPRSLTYEQFNAAAYNSNPYKNPIIGWMNDIDNMKVEDLKVWYDQWYAPNNATLVVAGDVNPDEVYALAKKHFGHIKSRPVPALKPRIEAKQLGERRLVVRAPAKVPYMIMGYKVPVLRTAEQPWEPYALEVLAGILSGGDSARLPKELVRTKQIAVNADSGYNMHSMHNELFLLDGTPAQGHSISDVEKALKAQLEKIKQQKVGLDELNRIKAQVIANDVYEKDSVFYQAMALGQLETVGLGWQKADEYVEQIRAVTPEQIQQVAKKYLVDNTLTIAILEPQKSESTSRSSPQIPLRH